jgi:hypothetical protein
VSEPERLASELMADLHNNSLMTTVDLDGAANRIKDAIEQAIADEHAVCAKIIDASIVKVRAMQIQDEMEGMYQSGMIAGALAIAAAIRARGQTT